jgi:hypothetical protein
MAATLEIHFLTLKYTHCQFCQNYPKKVAKIKLILAKLAFATNYEVWSMAYIPSHILAWLLAIPIVTLPPTVLKCVMSILFMTM